ncbi:uncharacterized protein LOC121054224 [Oryza brachyantha]|uniref:uncharacterized protein LOC121054224 n=1 Tax=Oryza brachyantha TaxID=4533 RepID=UPI001AD965EA|nr:uncharacterized protein LOC121054224 [Oryza brachyantha]
MTATARGVGGSREAEEVIEVVVDISTSPAVRVGPVMAMRSAMGVGLAAADVRPVLAIGVATTCGAAVSTPSRSRRWLHHHHQHQRHRSHHRQANISASASSEEDPGQVVHELVEFCCTSQVRKCYSIQRDSERRLPKQSRPQPR